MSVHPLGPLSPLLNAPQDLYLTATASLDVFDEGRCCVVLCCGYRIGCCIVCVVYVWHVWEGDVVVTSLCCIALNNIYIPPLPYPYPPPLTHTQYAAAPTSSARCSPPWPARSWLCWPRPRPLPLPPPPQPQGAPPPATAPGWRCCSAAGRTRACCPCCRQQRRVSMRGGARPGASPCAAPRRRRPTSRATKSGRCSDVRCRRAAMRV
jgi:hypothetical protein